MAGSHSGLRARKPPASLASPPVAKSGAADVLAVGSGATIPRADVIVPITVRDLSSTPLDEGAGPDAEIQGYAIKLAFSPGSRRAVREPIRRKIPPTTPNHSASATPIPKTVEKI